MPKLSKPILWAIFRSCRWAAMALPDAPGYFQAIQPAHASKLASTDGGYSKETLTRISRGTREVAVIPFHPRVINITGNSPVVSLGDEKSGWALTGINSVDGNQTACVEKQRHERSVFLKKGQTWNGPKSSLSRTAAFSSRTSWASNDPWI